MDDPLRSGIAAVVGLGIGAILALVGVPWWMAIGVLIVVGVIWDTLEQKALERQAEATSREVAAAEAKALALLRGAEQREAEEKRREEEEKARRERRIRILKKRLREKGGV